MSLCLGFLTLFRCHVAADDDDDDVAGVAAGLGVRFPVALDLDLPWCLRIGRSLTHAWWGC